MSKVIIKTVDFSSNFSDIEKIRSLMGAGDIVSVVETEAGPLLDV